MLRIQKILHFSGKNISTNLAACHQLSSIKFMSTDSSVHKDSLSFKEDIKQLQTSLQKIIDVHINPFVDEWEAAKIYPAHKIMKKLGEAGFLGISHPVEYGGLGLDYRYTMAAMETYSTISCGGIPMSIGVQTDMATPALARFGSEYLKKEFLVPTIAGDVVTCVGVSEPQAGSDVSALKTTAKKSGDDLIINGQKMWITNGVQADWMCLLANTSQGSPHKNKSLICLPMKTPGVHVAKNIEKIGMYSSDTAQIFFEDVRIPAKNIIGEEGLGFIYQMLQFQQERLVGAALAVYPLERCIKDTIAYTKERKIFGKPVLHNQVIHYRLAELQTEVEALKALINKTTDAYVEGDDVTLLASMAKLKAGRLCREIPDACLQYWGGMGYTSEVYVSRMYRDMRLLSIGGGADEVMLSIICKLMGILPVEK
ncbi:putative acyl-CoA dehydrogenase 6 [Armadillidium nasatum]|uniref:Putative acyl-CoA dehydrogenase 6 n=1 Tax=Armadillidium nasatum TaxID=96803 RepID=A0A5N5SQ31_9CRUS|nr:putative acyl-CoA dehydrogenase 6 [Armadillidium nasatum]